jgi:EpsD family peptidyl-prolyl cis-trans isomerase
LKRGSLAAVALAALVQLAACGEKDAPKGQVVATVNGTEITASELQAEAEALRADLSAPGVRQQILELVIQRQLQAAAAKQRGLDKDPRFLAQKRRAEQYILAQMHLMSVGAGAEVDMRQARSFIIRNPALFDERQVLVIDRIGFAPAQALSKAEVAGIKTMPQAEQLLLRKKIRFDRRSAVVDPADLPPKVAENFAKMPNGVVFYDSQGDNGMFGAIVERKPDPVPMPEQLAKASAILKRQKRQETIEAAVRDLRKRAKITYQQGFGPTAPKAKLK